MPAESLENAAFRSGAALAHLAIAAENPDLPAALWRDRLALASAAACARLTGRPEGQAALRDALHLTRAGDNPGPAGAILRQWSRAVERPISPQSLFRALERTSADDIARHLATAGPTPVDRAARVVDAVLTGAPRAEAAALILGDAVLSKSLGWTHILPLLSLALAPRALRLRGDDLRLACHRATVDGAAQALPLAGELIGAAGRLRAIVPNLRAKGAARAVDLFLSRDALAPSALAFMSDRAARRLCDRLVDLGALREMTGRDTFRLYGI